MFDQAGEPDHATSDLRTAAQALVAVDTDVATDDELMSTVLGIESARRLLDAAECTALAELNARNSTDLAEGMRTNRWLAHHAGIPAGVASARVKVGRHLRSVLPDVAKQLAEGRMVASHRGCNTRQGVGSIEELPTHEGDLRPCLHEYHPLTASVPRSMSCSAPAATSPRSLRR